MTTIRPFQIPVAPILTLHNSSPSPFYLYDEKTIRDRCKIFNNMPNAFGLIPRFAMKANSTRALLQLITNQGFGIDASSLNEVRRAVLAGISVNKIMLTTQEVPRDRDLDDLIQFIQNGLCYTICSITQLKNILPFVPHSTHQFAIRLHPGFGSGETASRDTGSDYASFGVHLSDINTLLNLAKKAGILFTKVHIHIGSGGDPLMWKKNIDRQLEFIERWFPEAQVANFGGGFKDARMPEETAADITALGDYAQKRIKEFYTKTGKKLLMEIEPGTYIIANAGYLVTRVIDIKQTGKKGFTFIVLNGGMEVLSRPLLYGSQHPFYIISNKDKTILFDEFNTKTKHNSTKKQTVTPLVVVGRCCETGDSFTLDTNHNIRTRTISYPEIGDIFIVGGAGAYASSMTPFNYNSHVQIAEYLYRTNGRIQCIRKRQTLEQIIQNEMDL